MKKLIASLIICFATTVAACGSSEPTGHNESSESPGFGVKQTCFALSEAECIATEQCMPLAGQRIDNARQCVDPVEFVGCVNSKTCGEPAVVWAMDASGNLWQFPDTCTPPWWVQVSSHGYVDQKCGEEADPGDDPPGGKPKVDCSGLSLYECMNSKECAQIIGRRIDLSEECLGAKEVVDCMEPAPCGSAATTAVDPSGNRWEFPSTCTPNGWEQQLGSLGLALCSPDTNGDAGCFLLTEGQCLANDSCARARALMVDETEQCVDGNVVQKLCMDPSQCEYVKWGYVQDPSGTLWVVDYHCPWPGWTTEAPPDYDIDKCGAEH